MTNVAKSDQDCQMTEDRLVNVMHGCLEAFDPNSNEATPLGTYFDGKSAVHWEDFVCYTILSRYRPCYKLTNWPPLEEWIEMSILELARWLISSSLANPEVGPKMLSVGDTPR